jgi:hypothetical protein
VAKGRDYGIDADAIVIAAVFDEEDAPDARGRDCRVAASLRAL